MLGTNWPRNGSRRGPSKKHCAALHVQICALHTHLVSTSVAARVTAEEGIINKLGRSAISE